MKTHIFSLSFFVCFLMMGTNANAQEGGVVEEMPTTEQSFSLVYIAQDNSTPPAGLEKNLKSAWNRAMLNGPTIFFLSRGKENPIIVRANFVENDNRDDFDNVLIPAINQNNIFNVDGPHDKQCLLELLQQHSIIRNDGVPLYKETNFDFHVGQSFWTDSNNEAILAALFFELNIKKYIADNFHFHVFCPREVKYNEEDGPFGVLNPDDCQRYINLDRCY